MDIPATRNLEVVTLITDATSAFDALAVAQVFDNNPFETTDLPVNLTYVSCAETVTMDHGTRMETTPLRALRVTPDIVIIPGFNHTERIAALDGDREAQARFFAGGTACCEELASKLRAWHAAGTPIASMCTATFLLGWAGMLDGVSCTTHWSYLKDLIRQYERADVALDRLVVHDRDARIWSSTGGTACTDLCLALLADTLGQAPSAAISRGISARSARTTALGREALTGSRMSSDEEDLDLERLLARIHASLSQNWTLETVASALFISPRTFQRRFSAYTGSTFSSWLLVERISAARELLEITSLPVEAISERIGLSPALLRRHFSAILGMSPTAYRKQYQRRMIGFE